MIRLAAMLVMVMAVGPRLTHIALIIEIRMGPRSRIGFLFKNQDTFRPAIRSIIHDARAGASARDWIDVLAQLWPPHCPIRHGRNTMSSYTRYTGCDRTPNLSALNPVERLCIRYVHRRHGLEPTCPLGVLSPRATSSDSSLPRRTI